VASDIYSLLIEEFTSTILAKNTAIAAAGGNVECTICREPILDYAVVGLIYISALSFP